MTRGPRVLAATLALAAVVACGAARADDSRVYQWTDAEGKVHWTQGLERVPERFRKSAVDLGSVRGETARPAAPPPAPAPAAVAPAPPAAPAAAKAGPADAKADAGGGQTGDAKPAAAKREPPWPKTVDPVKRKQVDDALEQARTVAEYLAAAYRYRDLGAIHGARYAANKAAGVATSAGDWNAIADLYESIEATKEAREARQKATPAVRRW
jgi:hypothetical protein